MSEFYKGIVVEPCHKCAGQGEINQFSALEGNSSEACLHCNGLAKVFVQRTFKLVDNNEKDSQEKAEPNFVVSK